MHAFRAVTITYLQIVDHVMSDSVSLTIVSSVATGAIGIAMIAFFVWWILELIVADKEHVENRMVN